MTLFFNFFDSKLEIMRESEKEKKQNVVRKMKPHT